MSVKALTALEAFKALKAPKTRKASILAHRTAESPQVRLEPKREIGIHLRSPGAPKRSFHRTRESSAVGIGASASSKCG